MSRFRLRHGGPEGHEIVAHDRCQCSTTQKVPMIHPVQRRRRALRLSPSRVVHPLRPDHMTAKRTPGSRPRTQSLSRLLTPAEHGPRDGAGNSEGETISTARGMVSLPDSQTPNPEEAAASLMAVRSGALTAGAGWLSPLLRSRHGKPWHVTRLQRCAA